MANDFANIKTTAYQRFFEVMGSRRDEWMKVARMYSGNGASISVGNLFGTTAFAAQSAGTEATAQDLDTVKNVVSALSYEKRHRFTLKDQRDNPEIGTQIGQMVADAALSTIAASFWTTFGALDTTLHPGNQAPYIGGAGGSDPAYYADAAYTAPVAQGNLLTTAFSASALSTAKAALGKYKMPSGLPAHLDISNANLALTVTPDLEAAAYEVVSGAGEGGGSTEGGFNRGIDVVVDNYSADTNNWALVCKSRSPVGMWIRSAPQLFLEYRLGHLDVYCEYESATVLSPDETGIIYSKVA